MTTPSPYELDAWNNIQNHRAPVAAQVGRTVTDGVTKGASAVGRAAKKGFNHIPGASDSLGKGLSKLSKSADFIGDKAKTVSNQVPTNVVNWGKDAVEDTKTALSKVARAGLTPEGIVKAHQKKGHPVENLYEIRALDLKQVDAAVSRRGRQWIYPMIGALSGAAAGIAITGGEAAVTVSSGVAAAPSAAIIAGSISADAAVVLGLSSRVVGQIALSYGYDPEEPAEKIFLMSVINAGSALSSASKFAAFRDISKLTQSMVRGGTWKTLNNSIVSQVYGQFAKMFGVRLTKQGLGKLIPAVGVLVGGVSNWSSLESVVDTADLAYRRRFLMEKYPHLAEDESSAFVVSEDADSVDESHDETISVLEELAEAGGPDLSKES